MRTLLLLGLLCASCSDSTPAPAASAPKEKGPPKVKLIASGTEFDITEHLQPGYVVIVDFYTDT